MACGSSVVHLGFEDEQITDKYKGVVNFTVNKIGGKPVSIFYVHFSNNGLRSSN